MKRNAIILMVVLLVLGWYKTISGITSSSSEYTSSIENGKKNDAKGMYSAAIGNYQTALTYDPDNLELKMAVANDYYELNDVRNFEAVAKEIINEYDANQKMFDKLMNLYQAKEDYDEALSYLHELMEKFPEHKYISEKYNEMKGLFESGYNTYRSVKDFYNGYAIVESDDGQYGVVSTKDEVLIGMRYDEVDAYNTSFGAASVLLDDGTCCYVNNNGHKVLVPDFETSYLGIISDDMILAQDKKSGKFGFINMNLETLGDIAYTDATAMINHTAAVKMNDKWILVDNSLKQKGEGTYNDVVMDDNRIATRNGVVWVKNGSKYQLITTKGEPLTEAVYDEAKPFVTAQPAAACKNGKWGFVDVSGAEVTDFIYEDADSFGAGFAPVKNGEYWVYIDFDGNICIDQYFTAAQPFISKGVTFVQQENSYWFLIDLIDIE